MVADKPRALLIDDERFARQLYSDYLVAAGCDVETAESAQVVRALFVPGRYQIVVTDLLLPDSDGLEILSEVKRRDPDVDVIVITGLERVEPAVRAMRGGASDYLVKPVTPEALQLAVSRCLSMRRVLQENASLKQSLALLEASQRVSAATDRGQVAEALLPALITAVGARAGLLMGVVATTYELVRAEGITAEDQDGVVKALKDGPLATFAANGAVVLDAVEGTQTLWSISGLCTVLVPMQADGRLHGVAVLFCEGLPAPIGLRSLEFLAGSAAVSLSTIQRFDRAERLAYIDDLTHLFNARYLFSVLDRETTERGSGGPFALLFLDLDHFKAVNDTHGHLVGSTLLIEVARVLKTCVCERDICTRYGGDEFCIVLPRSDTESAVRVAERIRSTIAEYPFLAREGRSLKVTASIGVACFPEHATDKAGLLELADQAMYRGKRTSRNVIYVATGAAA